MHKLSLLWKVLRIINAHAEEIRGNILRTHWKGPMHILSTAEGWKTRFTLLWFERAVPRISTLRFRLLSCLLCWVPAGEHIKMHIARILKQIHSLCCVEHVAGCRLIVYVGVYMYAVSPQVCVSMVLWWAETADSENWSQLQGAVIWLFEEWISKLNPSWWEWDQRANRGNVFWKMIIAA